MTLQDCPFWSLLVRETEPEQRFYNHAVARLEAHKVDLELITKDDTLNDAIELRPAQILTRLVKVFRVLETKPYDNSASIEMFKHIVRPLVQMHNGPFSLDQRVDLVGSALPTLTLHLTTDLRDVATLLLSEEKLFEKLLASEKHAPVMQRWLSSRQHQQLLGQSLLENLIEKSISLGENCSGDHGISRECEEWRFVQELTHATNEIITSTHTENEVPASQTQVKLIPLSKMKVLGEDDKKTHQARQEKKKSYKLPGSVEDGLIKLGILLPQGSNGLRQTREQLQGKASQLICAAVNSFPCRFCSERLAGDMITSKVTTQSPNAYPATSNDAQVNLYGERLGAWKILLSELAMAKTRKLIESGMLPNIERTLRELAQGNWKKSRRVPQGSDPSLVPVTPVRGTPLTAEKDYFILWQIDAGYYDELTKRKQFGQIIKVWDIVTRDESLPSVDRIIKIQEQYNEDLRDTCKMPPTKLPDGTYFPQRWEILPAYNSTLRRAKGKEESQILTDMLGKYTNVTVPFLRALAPSKGYEEFPFELSREEIAIVNHSETSSLILGRSGTGKTTCLLFKLLGRYQSRETIPHSERIKQLLLTRSPHLAAKLKTYARNLIDTASGNTTLWIPPDQEPEEVLKLQPIHFPFICTYEKFLGIVENSIRNSDRQKFGSTHKKGRSKTEETGGLKRNTNTVVDFFTFKNEYWGCLSSCAPSGCPPELIFAEIMGVIRGSRVCARNLQPLDREEYVLKGSKVSPAFPGVDDRKKAFEVYERYEKLKKQRGQIDDLDRVMDVLKFIAETPSFASQLRGCFEEIYVDEIQDLRCVDVALLFKAVFNARGVHLAGDTAQCISKDSVFRFPEIRAAFFDEHEATAAFLKQNIAKPQHFMLARNYRSHQGILSFASWVMHVLWSGFPETIDKLDPEIGQIDGPIPIIFAGFDCSVLSSKMIGVVKMDDKVANFGAEQVILVRDDKSKIQLQSEIGEIALVLTILESKGMEFDDVLIYDFFGGSELSSSYRCLHLLAQESRGSFDSRKHAALCAELKQLYVAVTHARKQLWFMEIDESAIDSLIKALAANKSSEIVDVARKRDAQSAEKLKTLRAGGSVDTTQWQKRAAQLFDQMNYQSAIFCYNRAGDDKGAKRAAAFDSRREGRSRRFTDIESSTTFFEKAIELFIEINLLEDAADCYEQIGRYDEAAEYWKEEGQLQRAARLYEMGMNFRAASECYDADGDFEKAVETLRQGGEFDELIHYLDRNPEKLESKFKHRYSRLCNILLKQGRISSDLRATTINLLGSEEKKLEFFQEFEMTEDLSSYYASHEKWLELYELSLANGEVLAAVSIVLEHDLIEKVDPECFEQALNYSLTESIYLNSNWSRAGLEVGKEHASFLLLSKFEEAFRETWLKSHLSQWRVTLSVLGIIRLGDEDIAKLAPTGSSLMGNFTCLALAGLGAQVYLQECENVRQLLLIPILKYANIIQELEDGPSREATSLASLHLICGIYNRDTYGKPSMIFNWSPIASDGNKDEETSADELTKFTSDAIEWAKDMLAKAIVMFNERARDLMFREFPKRCGAFLIRGSCMKQNAGQCNYFHEQPNAKVCQVCLFSIAHIADFYCRLNRLYYRRIMPVSFQESFPGRRRYWLQQLEEEISFVSSFEQSSEALMELRYLFQQDSRYDFTISCWKDLLLYRLTDNWPDIQPFTAILRQMEFAHFLGTTTERFFRQVLWRHVDSIMHRQRAPSLSLKVAQDAIRLRQRVLFLASKARDRYGCTNLLRPMLEILSVARSLDGSQMLYLHSLISVIELGVTAFLCAINPANAIVIPSSWAFLYLPDLFKAPLPMGAPEPREQDRKDRIPCLKDALISFCGAFDDWSYGMNHSLQLRGFHGRVYTGILRKRVFDLLATVILNLNHYPSRLRDMDNFWRRITKTMSGLTSSTWTNQMDAPGKMRAGAKSSFEAYNGKNKLQVVTLDDKPSAPLYLQGFVDSSTPVLKLSQCVKTRMQQTDQSNPPPSPGLRNEPSSTENAEEFSPEQVSQLTTIQTWWRRIRKIREGNRKRMATPEGQTLSKIHKICQMTLSSEQANKQSIPKCDHIKARRLIFTSGYCAIMAQGKLTNAFKRAREKMRSCFNNKALTPENLTILDTLKSELVSVEKSYKDVVKQFSLGTLTMVLNSYEDLTEFEIRIEVVLARTLEIQEIVSKIRCRVDAISKG